VPGGFLNPYESDFKDQLRSHRSHWAETLQGISLDNSVHLVDFLIAQTRVSLGKGDQGVTLVDGEGLIRVETGPPSVASLRIN